MSPARSATKPPPVSPADLYGPLFVDVQLQGLFADGKTFVDAWPVQLTPEQISAAYAAQKEQPGFSLAEFVAQHFRWPSEASAEPASAYHEAQAQLPDVRAHIRQMWLRLQRHTPDGADLAAGTDSLIPLPHPYVVPGGRFRETYYWDSCFTMQGLVEDGHIELAQGMLDNFAHLIDRLGYVPNGNRSYMLSRSQPPFFFKMVATLALGDAAAGYARYLRPLLAEHRYWMQGEAGLQAGQAQAHLVRLADGALLNRYWDARCTPREESYREDVHTASCSARPASEVLRDLRAGAESGWDFSSRWCRQPEHLHTIETTAILPVDLNSLLWGLECAIAQGAIRSGAQDLSAEFTERAQQRQLAMQRLLWATESGHFVDYHWQDQRQCPALTAAALMPLYTGWATAQQAQATARAVRSSLLGRNGLMATVQTTGHQWDAPNGWAPLQMVAVEGLQRYGEQALAADIAWRWMGCVERVFRATGRLLEKYNAEQDLPGGGGEYPTQDGFGWTNASFTVFSAAGFDAGGAAGGADDSLA